MSRGSLCNVLDRDLACAVALGFVDLPGVAANPQTFFQLYWMGSRARMVELLDRARAAGARGLIVTLDWTFAHRRDWG